MRVLVTGASGHIGLATTLDLLAAGHHVVGLVRSDAGAARLATAGAEVLRGDLDDLEGLRRAAAAADGVVHLAFKHDIAFSGDYEGAVVADRRALEALAAGLEGSNKPFVGTAGTLALASLGRLATEDDALTAGPRIDAENFVVGLAAKGVRSSVVRLAPSVHSDLDRQGFVPAMVGFARKNGHAAYVGTGENRWPALHTLDAARLYRLALERAPAGSRLHGIADEGVPFRDIAEAIGRGLGVPAKSVPAASAAEHLGFLAHFAQLDNPMSGAKTRALLDWAPTHADLRTDLASKHYYGGAQPWNTASTL